MKLLRILSVAVLLPLAAIAVSAVLAQTAPGGSAPVVEVGVDPKALALMRGMSDRLAAAESMSFSARRAFDEPAANGQPHFYTVVSNVVLQRPDKLKAMVPGDGPPS